MKADREFNFGNELIRYASQKVEAHPLGQAIKRFAQPENIARKIDDSLKFNLAFSLMSFGTAYQLSGFVSPAFHEGDAVKGSAILAGTLVSMVMGGVFLNRAGFIWGNKHFNQD